uniref:cytokine receptor common subunit beta-like n=1 Tax=Urocitellus parryii TaxID=9999 RepID=UPI000E55A7DD|nr:cytokine receptor common subunit beta-like [Urocitellus parryii]
MALTWGLLLLALQALWGQWVTGAEETIPLKTLRCYNNYTSRIVCRWADTQDALDRAQPVSCEINKDPSSGDCPAPRCVHRKCLIPYQEFALADHDYYFFQPDRPLGSQLSVPLMERPTLKVTKDRDSYSLRWQVEKMYYTHLGQTFEVQYRRDAEDWGCHLLGLASGLGPDSSVLTSSEAGPRHSYGGPPPPRHDGLLGTQVISGRSRAWNKDGKQVLRPSCGRGGRHTPRPVVTLQASAGFIALKRDIIPGP